jgi:hypothetical protein
MELPEKNEQRQCAGGWRENQPYPEPGTIPAIISFHAKKLIHIQEVISALANRMTQA